MSFNAINIVLYIRSNQTSSQPMIDRMGSTSSCHTRADLDSLKSKIASSSGKFFSTEDQKALLIIEEISQKYNIRVKIVDIGSSVLERLKLLIKGKTQTPLFVINGKAISDIGDASQLLSNL